MADSNLYRQPTGKKLPLEHVDKPNLLRTIFPYDEVPKTPFDPAPEVPMNPPDDIWITCTTFRDGQQARPPYSVQQIVDLYDMMARLGGPNGVIRQSEFFLYSQKDREAIEKCQSLGYRYPEVTGWIRAEKKDLKLVKEIGLEETGILTSASDYHIFLKLNKSREAAMNDYLNLVRETIEAGIKPRCHLEDLTRADIYGFIVPYVQELMEISRDSGVPVKVRLCDTMGYGISYPGAGLPRSVPKLVNIMIQECGVPKEQLEWHGHNDFHKVHINGITAWLYGCAALNGTLLGFGERTGNPPIEGACLEYVSLTGSENGMDLSVITEIANYFVNKIGFNLPANYPFVGSEFNVTSAGIHADGLIKNEEIYNIFDTAKILNRPLGVAINDKAGIAGIAYWVNSYLGLKGEYKIDKRHPGILMINDWVNFQYKELRITSISNDEMLQQAKLHLPTYFK
ncbi:MAG: 2-isopropylmalate synthase [Candidatus Tectomicrobia bacterium]|uniref:2-isopropylmalate synthase n=1 Tax=Tectimicrobiota bacterium TaxID=2528274 RepID=A0A933LQA9_UNCTE|nr:2-isopropylmalate synthase [Candidatus Tectomicrobia bacterium]